MMNAVCKMTGEATTWPCSAHGCPVYGDCLSEYAGNSKPMTNADALEQLQAENEMLKSQVPRWIPVEGRKPASSDNPILIYKAVNDRNNNIGTAWYSPYHGWIPTNGTEIYGITHWMPLPKPPKEDNL